MVLITAELTQPRNTVGLNIINAYMISVLIKIVKLLVFFRFLSFVRSFNPITLILLSRHRNDDIIVFAEYLFILSLYSEYYFFSLQSCTYTFTYVHIRVLKLTILIKLSSLLRFEYCVVLYRR